jgi:hypothetical protein
VSKPSADRQYLPDEYLIELGKIVQSWTALDEMLNLMIQKLAGFDNIHDVRSIVLTVHSSFPQRMDIFKSLCEHYKDSYPHLSGYREIARQISDVQALRNAYMHSVLGYNDEDGQARMARLSARGKIKSELREFSVADLRSVVSLTQEAGRALYRLVLQADPWPLT